jgi:hypothetical protein
MVVILRVQGGFCNRLRAIVSGVLWAEDLNRKLVIYWPVEPGHMPCALADILVPESIPRLCCVHSGYITKAHAVQSPEDMITMLKVFGPSAEEIRIESYSSFHPDANKTRGQIVLQNIQIQADIMKIANETWAAVDGKSSMVGVHFRGTDFANRKLRDGRMASTLADLIGLMKEEKETTHFCLTTDDSGAGKLIQKEFPGRVVMPTDVKGRKLPNQQIMGVVDWLLLQKCCKILGSLGSSFNEEAARRSGAPLFTPGL